MAGSLEPTNEPDAVAKITTAQEDVTVAEPPDTIAAMVGFNGILLFDSSKRDRMPRKLVGTCRTNSVDWNAITGLQDRLRHSCGMSRYTGEDRPGGGVRQ